MLLILTVNLKINATSNDILKIQRVDGSLLYDALELSFNMIDKLNLLKTSNVDILIILNLKASASNVYTKQEINNNDIIYANALNNKADKSNSYTKTEIRAFMETQYSTTAPLVKSVNTTTGIFTIGIDSNASLNNTFTDVVKIRTPAILGGNIRIIPASDGYESSIAYYARNDTRHDVVGDGRTCGVNCWDNQGNYSIGTPGLNNCFNIDLSGNVYIPYNIITPEIKGNRIKTLNTSGLIIDDYVTN